MYCATFYSYKGGVGRTLALANVGISLAMRGKKVLLVDFDLEAPGLTTLDLFSSARGEIGIVEWVQEFLEIGSVPDATKYIHTCHVSRDSDAGDNAFLVHLMPAGADTEYPLRFGAIDWSKLYSEQDGFLLVEDLRQQWTDLGFDYVLIDSRTGLTDVGGICTRQLPDATVVVFFPNEQNLVGLKEVVTEIRATGARPRPIDLLFAASRLPRLDDEHGVLRGWLGRFQDELSYRDEQLSKIDHYDSLALLDQAIFTLNRPNSGLAKQYVALADAIARQNVEDPDGALAYINSLLPNREPGMLRRVPLQAVDDVSERLDRIGKFHSRDYVIQHALARVFYFEWRELDKAAAAANQGLNAIGQTAVSSKVGPTLASQLHQLRIRLFSELNDNQAVASSALAILNDPIAMEPVIIDALVALARVNPRGVPEPSTLLSLNSADGPRLVNVARRLSAVPGATDLAATIGEMASSSDKRSQLPMDDSFELVNILIAGRKFDCALEISLLIEEEKGIYSVGKTFNTAMALWGSKGKPEKALFERVLALAPLADDYQEEPNFIQCLALCYAVVGQRRAMKSALERALEEMKATASGRQFSCWTYTTVSRQEFEAHCLAIGQFGIGKGPPPTVVVAS